MRLLGREAGEQALRSGAARWCAAPIRDVASLAHDRVAGFRNGAHPGCPPQV